MVLRVMRQQPNRLPEGSSLQEVNPAHHTYGLRPPGRLFSFKEWVLVFVMAILVKK